MTDHFGTMIVSEMDEMQSACEHILSQFYSYHFICFILIISTTATTRGPGVA
jgi:hypothetical protein